MLTKRQIDKFYKQLAKKLPRERNIAKLTAECDITYSDILMYGEIKGYTRENDVFNLLYDEFGPDVGEEPGLADGTQYLNEFYIGFILDDSYIQGILKFNQWPDIDMSQANELYQIIIKDAAVGLQYHLDFLEELKSFMKSL